MPLLLVFLALFGVGWFARDELRARPVTTIATTATIAPAHGAWAASCQAQLQEATARFERDAGLGCGAGEVTVTTLPSGVDYVEYHLLAADGSTFQIHVTEEPQNQGEPTGWRGAPCRDAYDRPFQVVRHDHGRLALVSSQGPEGFRFAQLVEGAADFCIEEAE
jgi:hypothetical protein